MIVAICFLGMMLLLPSIIIDLSSQILFHRLNKSTTWAQILVSTAKNGAGERVNSYCTPRGLMNIRAKIGAGENPMRVFRSRRPSEEICTDAAYFASIDESLPGRHRDWILGRILWLSGLEPYINRLGLVDTMRRFIYIHGTPPQTMMKTPASMGCVRMQSKDLLPFFDRVQAGEQVAIVESLTSPWVVVQRSPMRLIATGEESLTVLAFQSLETLMYKETPSVQALTPMATLLVERDSQGDWCVGEINPGENLEPSLISLLNVTAERVMQNARETDERRRSFVDRS